MSTLGFRCAVVLSALLGSACQETTTLPTTPSTLPPDKVGVLTLTCPVDITVQSVNGVDARVTYPPARTSGGQEPVAVSCSPEPGVSVRVGNRAGSCTASDGLGQSVTCAFSIRVLRPPQLAKTKFLAFGDSLTAGVTAAAVVTVLEPSKSYPFQLQRELSMRYPVQTIDVVNAGLPGELATDGDNRIGAQIDAVRPEVVLIMEGTNDIGTIGNSLASTRSALDDMIDEAQSRGVDALVATVPPSRRALGGNDDVIALNAEIRSLAFARGVRLVDVYAAMVSASCPGLSSFGFGAPYGRSAFAVEFPCIGDDGIHPTGEGYGVMATAFVNAIVSEYDTDIAGARVSLSRDGARRMR
jgi:lysophospholipase L1-like esterase